MASRRLWLLSLVAVQVACAPKLDVDNLPEGMLVERIDDQVAFYGPKSGFTEMVPAVQLPIRPGGRSRIQVVLQVPEGKTIGVVAGEDTPRLKWPPGTRADRLESFARGPDEELTWTIADVRGGRLGPDGAETFHVFRPVTRGWHRPLIGLAWPRDRNDLRDEMVARFAKFFQAGGGFFREKSDVGKKKSVELFTNNAKCAECHQPSKPVNEQFRRRWPNRVADAQGWYGPQSVLMSTAPLEGYRPQDVNHNNPHVTMRCADESKTPKLSSSESGRTTFRCPDDALVWVTVDIRAAMAAKDPHAQRVCASRRYLHERMDAAARAAFAEPLSECGLGG